MIVVISIPLSTHSLDSKYLPVYILFFPQFISIRLYTIRLMRILASYLLRLRIVIRISAGKYDSAHSWASSIVLLPKINIYLCNSNKFI